MQILITTSFHVSMLLQIVNSSRTEALQGHEMPRQFGCIGTRLPGSFYRPSFWLSVQESSIICSTHGTTFEIWTTFNVVAHNISENRKHLYLQSLFNQEELCISSISTELLTLLLHRPLCQSSRPWSSFSHNLSAWPYLSLSSRFNWSAFTLSSITQQFFR